MTLTTSAGTAAGSYPLTITGTSGPSTRTASVSLSVTGGVTGGSLTGSRSVPGATIALTTEGTADWAHWGLAAATDFDHKAGVTQQISNFTAVGTGVVRWYANNPVGFTWTDGTPTASATGTTTGVYIAGQGQGFRITTPADTTVRTIRVYVGVWRSQARIIAHLSDGSAPDYSDGSLSNSAGPTTDGFYLLTYRAASAGQSLTITVTDQTDTVANVVGNVALQAATLQ
jgi:hypothetical protein